MEELFNTIKKAYDTQTDEDIRDAIEKCKEMFVDKDKGGINCDVVNKMREYSNHEIKMVFSDSADSCCAINIGVQYKDMVLSLS
jgi:hypothetical protein